MSERKKRRQSKPKQKITMEYITEERDESYFSIISNYLNNLPGMIPVTPQDIQNDMEYYHVYKAIFKVGEDVMGIGDCYVSKVDMTIYGENLLIHPQYQGHMYGGNFIMTVFDNIMKEFKKASGMSPIKMCTTIQRGNVRAVSLYERIGYFPSYDKQTLMQNFFSYVYDYSLGKKFFESQNILLTDIWKYYQPEEFRILKEHNIKNYPYVFKTKEGVLRIIIDAISERATWVENNDYILSCLIAQQEAYIGLEKRVAWFMRNNSQENLVVKLNSFSNGGISFKKNEKVVLRPGEEKVLKVAVIAKEEKNTELNIVETQIECNGQTVQLATGYTLKPVIQCNSEREFYKPFRLSEEYTKMFKVTNCFNDQIKVIGEIKGLDRVGLAHNSDFALLLNPGDTKKIPVTFKTLELGCGQILAKLKIITKQGEMDIQKILPINILDLNGILAWRTDNAILAENENVILIMPEQRRDGSFYLFDKQIKKEVLFFPEEEIGPPFIPDFVHYKYPRFDIRANNVRTEDGKIILYTEFENKWEKGLYILREIKLSASKVLSIDYRIENRGDKEISAGILRRIHSSISSGKVSLPHEKGLINQQINGIDFPGKVYDVKCKETWTAVESRGNVIGVVWKDAKISYRNANNILPQLDTGKFSLSAGGSVQIPTIFIYYGPGRGEDVRHLYQTAGYGKTHDLQSRELLDINLSDRQLVLNQQKGSFPLKIDRLVEFSESRGIVGDLKVAGPTGWKVAIEEENLLVQLPENTKSGMYSGEVVYDSPQYRKVWPLHFLVTNCSEKEVVISEDDQDQELMIFDNHTFKMQVAPNFKERIISMQVQGSEYLCSSYPKADAYHKTYPWYGGIGTALGYNRVNKEGWYKAEYQMGQSQWRGIGFAYSSADLNYHSEYLTVSESSMLVVHGCLKNQSKKTINEIVSIEIFLDNLTSKESISAYTEEQGKFAHFTFVPEKEKLQKIIANHWVAVETGNGDYLTVINPTDHHKMIIHNWGIFGVHLEIQQNVILQANEEQAFSSYIILEKDLDAALKYKCLKPLLFEKNSYFFGR